MKLNKNELQILIESILDKLVTEQVFMSKEESEKHTELLNKLTKERKNL